MTTSWLLQLTLITQVTFLNSKYTYETAQNKYLTNIVDRKSILNELLSPYKQYVKEIASRLK